MTSWFTMNLGDAMLAPAALSRIAAVAQAAGFSSVDSEPAAIYVRHESASLHCEVVVYFSPLACGVARCLAARPCVAPATQGLCPLLRAPGSIESAGLNSN